MKNAKVFYMYPNPQSGTLLLASEAEKDENFQNSASWFIPVDKTEENGHEDFIISDNYDFKVLHNGKEAFFKLERLAPNSIIYAVTASIGKFMFGISRQLFKYDGKYNSIKGLKNRFFVRLFPLKGEVQLEKAFQEHRFLFLGTPNSD